MQDNQTEKLYQAPELRKHGKISELTLANSDIPDVGEGGIYTQALPPVS